MLVDFLVEFFFVNFLPRDVNAVGYIFYSNCVFLTKTRQNVVRLYTCQLRCEQEKEIHQ